MISISLIHNNGNFVKLKVYGHSGYDISGRDIICAAVSSLTQSLIIGLERVISKDFYYDIDEDKPEVNIDISNYSVDDMEKAQILFKTFKYTIEDMIKEYRKYIKIMIKEDKK